MMSSITGFSEIEVALMKEAIVLDCAVRERRSDDGSAWIIAYVVPSGAFPEETVRANLRSTFPDSPLPDRYVLLSSLPSSSEGTLDEEALARLEIPDEQLAKMLEQKLLCIAGIQQAAVFVEPRALEQKRLHIADLLPGGQGLVIDDKKQSPLFPTAESAETSFAARGIQAISHGEPLRNPEQVPLTLQKALQRAAETKPLRDITYVQADGSEVIHTYQELLEDADHILGGLRSLGLGPGDKVIFQLDRNQDFIPAFWGCILGGFIPAPISIAPTYRELNSTISKLHRGWEMLGNPVILAGQGLIAEVRNVAELLNLENFRVETVERLRLRASAPDHEWHKSEPDDVCLILLTSGSTGSPKGVLQSHRSLMSRSAGTAQLNHFDERDVLLNWFPLDHVGGIVMSHLMALFSCASQIHVPTEMILQEPLKWLDLIERHRATTTWAPNFAFGLINDHEKQLHMRRWDLSSMKFILNGGEAIVPKTARRFLQLLAKHGLRTDAMHPAWGMSETCSGVAFSDRCSLDTVRDEDSFVEVGAPIPGVSFRIVDGKDQALDEGQIGCLQLAGLPVTTGYYKNTELNRECFSHDGWFNTGDLGLLRDGRLTITGRAKDIIIINGANFLSHEIESVVEELPGVDVSYTAAFAVRVASDNTDRLCIVFHPLVPDWAQQLALIKRIREVLVKKAGVNPICVIPVERGDIPKTAIGKIQRSALRQRFEAGEFDTIVKRIDLDTESSHTLPNWFFQKSWTVQQPRIIDGNTLKGQYLVFADSGGLADNLRRELGERAVAWIEVVQGEEFARIDSSRYRLNPAEPSNYKLLSAALGQDQINFDRVVHLWTYGRNSTKCASSSELAVAQHAGTYSVLHLAQILSTAHFARPVGFFVVSSQAQATCEQDRVASEKATLLGLLKTISLEMPPLKCRHVDLEGNSAQMDAQSLLQELAIPKSRMEVAYRGKLRLQAALSQVDMLAQRIQPLPITEGGLYLITGGLGGIGTHLSEFLSRKYKAKLILVGRTVVPDDQWTEAADQDPVLARRIRNQSRLKACGADFMYRSVNICDLNRLREVVGEAEERWKQPLTGIFHLAGEGNLERHWKVMDRHWVKAENTGTFEWMFGPKVYGTRNLFELIDNRPEVLFVAFSSAFSLFGSATSSAYSAASSFLDCFCEARRNTSHPHTYCFNWTVWDDVGMSEAGPASVAEAFRNMGYSVMSVSQALDSMIAVLLRRQHQVAIGLDLASPHVQRHTEQRPSPLRVLSGYYTLREGADVTAKVDGIEVRDRFGTKTQCRLVNVPPATLADMNKMPAKGNTEIEAKKRIPPATKTEQEIVRIWREVLAVPNVSMDDKFFQLGGDSLLALRVANRLRESLGVSVSLRDLFEMPTIAEFAAAVAERKGESRGLESQAMASAAPSSDDGLLATIGELPDEEIDTLLNRVSED